MREFCISDVLTITTGRLVSRRHMDGVYEILNHMTGDSIFTHQIPRAMKECQPALLSLYPHLGDDMDQELGKIEPNKDRAAIDAWLLTVEVRFGKTLPVPKLEAGKHQEIDPVAEAAEIFGEDRVFVVSG